jgi:hypothetical protein
MYPRSGGRNWPTTKASAGAAGSKALVEGLKL